MRCLKFQSFLVASSFAALLAAGACGGGGGDSQSGEDGSSEVLMADIVGKDLPLSEIPDQRFLPDLGEDLAPTDPCAPNPCTEAPESSCGEDGITLTTFASPGICTDVDGLAECEYPAEEKDCSLAGKVCLNAQCVNPESPCDPNPCTEPPAGSCDASGKILVTYEGPGQCSQSGGTFDCEYEASTLDCSLDGKICLDGVCQVAPPSCTPNPCTEPPADYCVDGITLADYPDEGLCEIVEDAAACTYEFAEVDCSAEGKTCLEGLCVVEGQGNTPAEVGQIIVTEFMAKSQGGADSGEWIELYNTTEEIFDLDTCVIGDGVADTHVIAGTLIVAPGGFVVLARSADPAKNHGLEPDYVYSGVALANDKDTIALVCGEVTIDSVAYTASFVVEGVAAQLDPAWMTEVANDDAANWCPAELEYGTAGKKGTPGAANTPCKAPGPCSPNPCTVAPDPTCSQDGLKVINATAPGLCTVENDAAKCTFPSTQTDCSLDGKKCSAGQCVDVTVDPCNPNPCAAGFTCVEGKCVADGTGVVPQPGDVVFTEFMAKSTGGTDKGEWVEVYNLSSGPVDLGGCSLKDYAADNHVIVGPLVIASGSYLLLARSAVPAENFGIEPDYVYTAFSLKNDPDDIVLQCGGKEVDKVSYTAAEAVEGVSRQLDPDAYDAALNDSMTNWCASVLTYGTAGKLGTPGLENSQCTAANPCDPNPCTTPPAATCDVDGHTLHGSEPTGACTPAGATFSCQYATKDTDCALDSKVCVGGACVVPPPPQPSAKGQVLVTEFMAKSQPSTDPGEWVELHNPTANKYSLAGCILKDKGTDKHTFTAPLEIGPGQYLLLARSSLAAENHGLPEPLYKYSNFTLANTSDAIVLECNAVEIDAVSYTDSWANEGIAYQLNPGKLNADANDLAENWCVATTEYGPDKKKGTPGAANTPCLKVGWCRLQFPLELTAVGSFTGDVYGRVHVAGVTNKTTGPDQSPAVIGQVGFGPDKSNPSTGAAGWTWQATGLNPAWVDTAEPGNDEYMGVMTATGGGTYDFAYRFSADAGFSWTYCDKSLGIGADGSENGYQPDNAGTLTIAAN